MSLSWIRVDVGLPRHEKSDLLDAALGERRTWSYVAELWMWAADNRADGNLAGLPDTIIAKRAGYEGDAARFVAALIDCRWLTPDRVLYKWEQRQGARAEKAERDAQRKREMRRADGARTAHGRPSDGAGNGTVRNGTVRNETEDRASVPATSVDVPDAAAPRALAQSIDPNRPEPLGPYGEVMPKAADEVLAFVHEGESLRERWRKEAPEFDDMRLLAEVKSAMNYRMTLEGHKRRAWFWPGGFVDAVDRQLRRARKTALELYAAEKRAAKAGAQAGEHVTAPPKESQAMRDERHREELRRKGLL